MTDVGPPTEADLERVDFEELHRVTGEIQTLFRLGALDVATWDDLWAAAKKACGGRMQWLGTLRAYAPEGARV